MRDEFHGEEFGYGIVADDAAEPVGSGIPEGLDKGIGAGFEFSENFGTDLDNWWGRVPHIVAGARQPANHAGGITGAAGPVVGTPNSCARHRVFNLLRCNPGGCGFRGGHFRTGRTEVAPW